MRCNRSRTGYSNTSQRPGDGWPLDVTEIADQVSENPVATRHYVDQLVHYGLLHEDPDAQGSSTFYLVTRKGRAYLVARGLV